MGSAYWICLKRVRSVVALSEQRLVHHGGHHSPDVPRQLPEEKEPVANAWRWQEQQGAQAIWPGLHTGGPQHISQAGLSDGIEGKAFYLWTKHFSCALALHSDPILRIWSVKCKKNATKMQQKLQNKNDYICQPWLI
jgi:hypothetical protein